MGAAFTADVVFVGSGVAAAVAGARLAAAGVKVLFLEAGPTVDRGTAVNIFQHSLSKAQNSPYPDKPWAPQPDESNFGAYYVQAGPDEFRGQQARVVGGTTWHWAGLAMRFRPNDFRLKSTFGVGVDWPFGYDALEPWYEQAEDELGVSGDDDFDWGAPRKSGYPMPKIPMSYADQVVGAAGDESGLHHRPRSHTRGTRSGATAVRNAAATRSVFRSVRSRRSMTARLRSPRRSAPAPMSSRRRWCIGS